MRYKAQKSLEGIETVNEGSESGEAEFCYKAQKSLEGIETPFRTFVQLERNCKLQSTEIPGRD